MIFDTDILIWYQRGNAKAAQAIDDAAERCISLQTYLELLQGARNKREQQLNKSFLRDLRFIVLPFSAEIGDLAVGYIERHALSSGLRAGDAIIAATAVAANQVLYTSNTKHYNAISKLGVRQFQPL